jgi:hypothetical protein
MRLLRGVLVPVFVLGHGPVAVAAWIVLWHPRMESPEKSTRRPVSLERASAVDLTCRSR